MREWGTGILRCGIGREDPSGFDPYRMRSSMDETTFLQRVGALAWWLRKQESFRLSQSCHKVMVIISHRREESIEVEEDVSKTNRLDS